MSLAWLLAGLPVLALILLYLRARIGRRASLTLEDALAAPGTEVKLRVEAEMRVIPFFDPAVRGLPVRVRVGENDLDEIRTGEHGEASAPYRPGQTGELRSHAELAADARYRAKPVEARVFVIDADRPLFVCDIDRTISRAGEWTAVTKNVERIPKIKGASDVLVRLADRFQIVYLSARDHIYLARTKDWLKVKGFPPGPAFLRGPRIWRASSREHKESRLQEILAPFSGPKVGIGDRLGDALAYRTCGLFPIYFGASRPSDLPEDIPQAATWDEVERLAMEQLSTRTDPRTSL